MANQNNDRPSSATGMKSSQEDPGLGARTGTPQTTGAFASGSTGTGSSSASQGLKESGGRMTDDAKQYAQEMASRAKEQGRTMFEQQKDGAAEQVASVAQAFHSTADQLSGEGQPQMGRYIAMAAEQIESFARDLRGKNLDTVLRDVEVLARRSPGVFFAGSVMAGFLFSRFLKSSSQRSYGDGEYEQYGVSDVGYDGELGYATYADDSFDTGASNNSTSGSSASSTGLDPVAGPMGDGTPSRGASGSTTSGGTTAGSTVGATGTTSTGSTATGSGAGTGTPMTGSSSTNVGADGTGTGALPSSSSGTQPGGNTYGNR